MRGLGLLQPVTGQSARIAGQQPITIVGRRVQPGRRSPLSLDPCPSVGHADVVVSSLPGPPWCRPCGPPLRFRPSCRSNPARSSGLPGLGGRCVGPATVRGSASLAGCPPAVSAVSASSHSRVPLWSRAGFFPARTSDGERPGMYRGSAGDRTATRRIADQSPVRSAGQHAATSTTLRHCGGWNAAKGRAGLATNPSRGSRISPNPRTSRPPTTRRGPRRVRTSGGTTGTGTGRSIAVGAFVGGSTRSSDG